MRSIALRCNQRRGKARPGGWKLGLLLPLGIAAAAPSGVTAAPLADTAEKASDGRDLMRALQAADLQLARVGYRLATRNAPLCDRLEPGTGLQLHTLGQYAESSRDDARAVFDFATPLAVEAVVPDSPAAEAGFRAGDSITAIGAIDLSGLGRAQGTEGIEELHRQIATLPATVPIRITVLRAGRQQQLTLRPVAACRTRFELRIADDYEALSDGDLVQVSSRALADYGESGLAVFVAHELAHNILHHRQRMEAQGIDFGLLAGLGGNVKYFRQTETQADILAIDLLANAGYDPKIAIDFWRRFGPSAAGGILRDRTHPGWRDRIATMEKEIARISTIAARPITSPLVATRDQPLDGDWQSILARH